ncbi:MAG: hypothetical protein FWE23_08955 [Chitinivibrionia bacterium]|nr:hypothetical protein [Chitinivibrionia bacterium]
MADLAVFNQDTIQAFIPEIELSMRSLNILDAFSYTSSEVENEETNRDKSYAMSNVIERKTLQNNAWGVKTAVRDTNTNWSFNDSAVNTGQITPHGSCNFGVDSITKECRTPGHNGTKSYKEQVQDFLEITKQEGQNSIVPRLNFEFFRALTRGASDMLFQPENLKAGNPLIAGTANVGRACLNFGIVNGDNVSIVPKPAPTTVINDTAWNTAVASAVSAATPTTQMTYNGLLKVKNAAVKNRVKQIKGKKYVYVLYCSLETAQSILDTTPNFQTQMSLAPEEVSLLGWHSYILSQVLVVGTPLMDSVYISDGMGGGFSGSTIDFGNTVANMRTIDVESIVAPTALKPAILCGEGAVLAGDDWKMRIIENESIAYKDITGRAFAITNDVGYTRKEFVIPQRFNTTNGISGGNPTYANMWNQNSMVFATTD